MSVEKLITDNLDIWTSAIKTKSASGRGSSNKLELYGIKKLRELILELAVRGKLVPQNTNGEPASKLLERIDAEKERLIKQEGLKTKANISIKPTDIYFECPSHWSVCRLGNLAKFIDYRGKTPKKIESGVRLITAKNVRFGYISMSPAEYISDQEYRQWMTRGFPRFGDLLFTPEAPLGNVALIDIEEKFALAQRAICFQFHEPQISPFLKYLIMSPTFQEQLIVNSSGMTATGIKAAKLKEIVIPIPPLEEQKRIVAKVDELMDLCDQLESQTEASIEAHQALVKTLLETLTNAKDAYELNESWQRISEHFDVLFTTEDSIDQLKQTILQLAVMGKLVKQDPNDEPASKLLERIAAEKEQLIKDKKIKKQKPFSTIIDEEKPLELPHGWKWARLGDLSSNIHYGYTASAKPENEGIRLLRITDIQDDKVNWETVPGCEITDEKSKGYSLENNDILIARTGGTIGKSYLVENINVKAVFASYLIRVKRISAMYSPFIKTYLGSSIYWSQLYDNASGTGQPNVNATALKQLLVPVAPLNEQKRIVAKVEALMILCDSLKARLKDAQTTQLHFTEAIVEQAS